MCWYCGLPVTDPEPLGRSLLCTDCGKDLRSCKNCRHYRPGGCAESAAGSKGEIPLEPDRANFCDWFSLNPLFRNASAGEKVSNDKKAQARSAFDDLFR